MPVGENIYLWDNIAANNGIADSLIDWHEGQTRASVNNSSRSEMAAHAKDRDLKNGSITTTGTANAHSFVSGLGFAPSDTPPTGMRIKLKIGPGPNDGPSTLNMDGTGAKTIKTANGLDLVGGELQGYVDFLYNGTNWVFLYSEKFLRDLISGVGGIIIGQQTFPSAGVFSYVPTPGMQACIIECIGGGGGGGSANGQYDYGLVGGGGGSGGYSRKLAQSTDIGSSQVVTVGAGGAGGIAGAGQTPGSPGGASSLGSLCVANGGQGGGHVNTAMSNPYAGLGGAPGTGD